MQALVEFIAGLVALLAAVALSQFGLDLDRQKPEREIHRVRDCDGGPASGVFAASAERKQDC